MSAGRAVVTVSALAIVYVAALGTLTPGDLAAGVCWAAVFLWWFHEHVFPPVRPRRGPGWAARVAGAVPLAAAVLADSLRGAVAVFRIVVSRRSIPAGGFIEVPVGERSALGVAAEAFFVSLSPGSVLVDVDEGRGVMLFHYLDPEDPETIRRRRASVYQRLQRRVIP